MRKKKLLCFGVAVMLMSVSVPQSLVYAQNEGGMTEDILETSPKSIEKGKSENLWEDAFVSENNAVLYSDEIDSVQTQEIPSGEEEKSRYWRAIMSITCWKMV